MFYLTVVIVMTSSFFFIKNKLGFVSLVVFGFLCAASMVEARITEVANDLSSEKELLLLYIHRVDNRYYVVLEDLMINKSSFEDKKNNTKYSDKVLKKTEDIEKIIPLGISRKEYKKILKNSLLPAYKGDLLQE